MPFFDDLGAAVGGAFCTWLGGVGNAEAWLQRSTGFPVGGVGAGIRGALCDDPTPPPATPPQITGGQCPGVPYEFRITQIRCNSTTPEVSQWISAGNGPINFSSPSICSEGGIAGDPECFQWCYTRTNQSESFDQFRAGRNAPSFEVRRADLQPDTCGNPDPIIPPFEPPNLPISVPDPDGGPDIDLDLTINAPIIIGPNIFAPISITGPDINFNGTIEFNPEFAIKIGSGFGGGGGDGTGVDSDPTDIEPDSPDNPPEADGREIIGLIVNLSFSNDMLATELAQDGDLSSIGVPRVAIAYLISNNGGVRVPLNGIDLKSRQTYIPVPPGTEVVTWRIHTEPGVTVTRVRPVYGTTRFPSA